MSVVYEVRLFYFDLCYVFETKVIH